MSPPSATTEPHPPVFPPGRYGRRREARRPRRALVVSALVAVLLAGLVVSYATYRRFGDPAYQPQVVGYTEITDSTITIRFRVRLPADRAAVCAVRARGRDGAVVGRAEVPVPGRAGSMSEVSYQLRTVGRPFVGEVTGCRPAQ